MIEFICAVYNEANEIDSLVEHIYPYVDRLNFVDDCSTDGTVDLLHKWREYYDYWSGITGDPPYFEWHQMEKHSGLPETVKNEALKMVQDGSWVLMLDADERFTSITLDYIKEFLHDDQEQYWDYVYFNQIEVIDGNAVRNFQKCKLFRKEAIKFPLDNIHADDQFEGRGTYFGWEVIHRKTSTKQIQRETEYLATYKKLLSEGKIDEGRYQWLTNLHHYVKPKG